MTQLQPQRGAIPAPQPSGLSAPFWDACQRGELMFQRCGDCGAATHTPAFICSQCASRALAWERSSGHGTIYSWTVVWRPQIPAFEVPYAPIIVDMDEGWQMLSNLVGCDVDAAVVGLPVAVEFHAVESGFQLPYFAPRARVSPPR
ncbi:MAG TPA: OB-fold domain-containing protein [Acidimicrobiia bacterium]